MRPLILYFLLMMTFWPSADAQYADMGMGAHKNSIWWFNWSGFTVQEGASRTFTTNDGLTVQISFSKVTPHVPIPYVMDTWGGALLHQLYDFSDPAIDPALFDVFSPTNFGFTLTVTASRNNVPVPFTFVTADAEASSDLEVTTLTTNGGAWQSFEFYRNSIQTNDPLSGCGTQTVLNNNTYAGSLSVATPTGQIPLLWTTSPGTSALVIQTNFDHGGTTGGMGIAFGIFESVDRGDLPTSYGTAQHQLLYALANSCNYNAPFPMLNQSQALYIGNVPGDPDPIQYADDDAIGVDEEGVSGFAVYDNSGSYSVSLSLHNTTGTVAWLTGWFDFNRNGAFDAGESVTIPVPNNAPAVTLTWTGLPTYLPQGTASGYGFRFRISSDQQAVQNATGYAPDGEVEDYFVLSPALCTQPVLSITPDLSICTGQQTALQVSGGATYAWSPAAGLSDSTVANPTASPAATTTYSVTGSTLQGCSAATAITVTVKPPPVIAVTGSTAICQGTSTTLTAAGGVSYDWSAAGQGTIGSNPSITVSPTVGSRYYVTGAAADGCSSTDTVNVSVQPPPVPSARASRPDVCKNDTVALFASGGDGYQWTLAGGQVLGTDSTITVDPSATVTYQVQISSSFCRSTATLTVPITVDDAPDMQITSSNEISCTNGQTTLQATGAETYQWINVPGNTAGDSPDQAVSPRQTTTYFVKGTGSNGCSSLDSITVKVDFATSLSNYPVAGAFTPNNDGNNDCWGLRNWGQLNTLEMSVYNRWGQRVFFTNDPNGCWDGTYKGVPQPAGGYIYEIKAATTCGTAFRKGVVMLIR